MPGVFIVPVKDLPQIRYEGDRDSFCETQSTAPTTAQGKWARSRGWRVGVETRLGELTLVNIMRRYHYEAQACGQDDGQILLFRDDRPVAAISVLSPKRSDTLAIEMLDDQESGAIRLRNQWVVPFGDLVVTGRDIEIRSLPASDAVCRGKLKIPNIFGQPIQQARMTLASAGWRAARTRPPVYTTNPDGSLTIENHSHFGLYKEGITEVSGCAPTGFCDFEYRSKRARLTVSTMGERAVSYLVACRG